MIKLSKGGSVMEVCNSLQASAFLRSGWTVVEDKPVAKPVQTVVEPQVEENPEAVQEKPVAKRGRKPRA